MSPYPLLINQTNTCSIDSAYIVPSRPLSSQEVLSFALGVQNWVSQRVAPHKRLRGGIIIIDKVPKRSGNIASSLCCCLTDELTMPVLLERSFVANSVSAPRRRLRRHHSSIVRSSRTLGFPLPQESGQGERLYLIMMDNVLQVLPTDIKFLLCISHTES